MNTIFITQWLFCGNSEILHRSDVFAHRQKLCKLESIYEQTRVNFLYCENMTSILNFVTATLRALFEWLGSCIKTVSLLVIMVKYKSHGPGKSFLKTICLFLRWRSQINKLWKQQKGVLTCEVSKSCMA